MTPLLAHAITVALGLVAVALGGPLVRLVFSRVDRRPRGPVSGDATIAPPPVQAAAAHLRGGSWIGALERLAIYASLLAGWPEGIPVALAVKGLARYPELRATTSGTAERFIIGTFTSVMWAAACAGVALWVESLPR